MGSDLKCSGHFNSGSGSESESESDGKYSSFSYKHSLSHNYIRLDFNDDEHGKHPLFTTIHVSSKGKCWITMMQMHNEVSG